MAKRIVRAQPCPNGSVPRRHRAGVEILIDVVNLVEEFPREQILAVAIARDQVAEPFLVNRPRRGVSEECGLIRAGTAVRDVVGIPRPVIVAAENVHLRLKHAVVIETEQEVEMQLLGAAEYVIELPGSVEPVARE